MNYLFSRWFEKNFSRCKLCACVVHNTNVDMHKESTHGIKPKKLDIMQDYGPNGRKW